jgi:DNA-binding NtrC family response regulator
MTKRRPSPTYRILVIDDNPAIHEDFRKILCGDRFSSSELEAVEAVLFETRPPLGRQSEFEIDSAYQGEQGLARVYHAIQEGRPYAMAFVDVRMPPGWDGLELTPKLWVADPFLPIVICTAYSDYSWEEMFARIGTSDRMFLLKKPFDRDEVLQLTHALTEKGRFLKGGKPKAEHAENAAQGRDLASQKVSEKLQAKITELRQGGTGAG